MKTQNHNVTAISGAFPSQNVISLIRVSTAEQAGEWKSGVTRQREHNQESAKQLGLNIVREVCAIDVSGRHVALDPDFQQLFRDLKRPDIAGVIVTEQSRLFRPDDWSDYQILDEFKRNKKVIWVKTACLDPTTQQGRMALTLGGVTSGEELHTLRARMQDGKRQARREGRHPGNKEMLPFGVQYKRLRDKEGRVTGYKWSLDPVESPKIKRAFELLLAGYSYQQIGDRVGLRDWSVRNTLSNPIWVGRRVYRYRASDHEVLRPGSTKPVRRSVLRDDPYEVDIKIPHLVSDGVFGAAQQIIHERSTRWRKSKLRISGVCGVCSAVSDAAPAGRRCTRNRAARRNTTGITAPPNTTLRRPIAGPLRYRAGRSTAS